MKYTGILLAIASAALLVGCMGGVTSGETASESRTGEARSAQRLVNVRSGPGFNYRIVYQVARGTALDIRCYTNDPQGNIWYQLGDGNYVLGSAAGSPTGYPSCYGEGVHQ